MKRVFVLAVTLLLLAQGMSDARTPRRHRVCCLPCSAIPATCENTGIRSDKQERAPGPAAVAPPAAVAYFSAKEMIVLRIQISEAMRLYKAVNGRGPKTHDEFMQKIVKANNLQLPELPPGLRYVYFPDREELMVEHPQPQ